MVILYHAGSIPPKPMVVWICGSKSIISTFFPSIASPRSHVYGGSFTYSALLVNNDDNFIQRLRHFLLFHKAESLEQTTDLIFAMPSFLCHKVDLCFHMFLCLTAWNNPCFKSNCDQQKYTRSETLR